MLATIPVPYEEWEVLYRQRLQVERDLRAGAMAGEAVVGAAPIEAQDGPEAAVRTIGRWVRAGAAAVVDAAADERTGQMIDRMAGSNASGSLRLRTAMVIWRDGEKW